MIYSILTFSPPLEKKNAVKIAQVQLALDRVPKLIVFAHVMNQPGKNLYVYTFDERWRNVILEIPICVQRFI